LQTKSHSGGRRGARDLRAGVAHVLARGLLDVAIVSYARQALGKRGEDLACRELERRGYAIVARRYRRRGGEIDIIARDGETVVFVEVKARENHAFGDASEAVTPFKRRRIAEIARDYLWRHHRAACPCRFDVVSIHFDTGRPVVELFQNAFDA
jgi:putative endonuclease